MRTLGIVNEINEGEAFYNCYHRMTAINFVDRISVLKGGNIIKNGCYEDLMKFKGEILDYSIIVKKVIIKICKKLLFISTLGNSKKMIFGVNFKFKSSCDCQILLNIKIIDSKGKVKNDLLALYLFLKNI